MKSYEQCEDVIFRLKTAWRGADAYGSLQRTKSALLDAASVLAPPDIQRIAVEASQRQPTIGPTASGQLTPELQLRTAHWCHLCAELCDFLGYMVKDEEAFKRLRFPLAVLDEGRALISKLWPQYLHLQTMAKIREEVPPEHAAQAELFAIILRLVRGVSEKLILPVLESWEFWLLFENAIIQIGGYLAKEPLAQSVLKAAMERDQESIVRLISSADTQNPRSAVALSALSFLGKMSGHLDICQYFRRRLAFQIVAEVIEPHYFTLAGGSRVLDQIAQSQVRNHFETFERSLSFDFAQREEEVRQFVDRLHSVLVAQQGFEIPLLEKKEEIGRKCQPVSLDSEVESEDGERVLLAELMRSEPDLMEALPSYYEAISTLPEDIQPIFRRVWEKGETPKEAAVNLGRQWTPALERQVERMTKKIRDQMAD